MGASTAIQNKFQRTFYQLNNVQRTKTQRCPEKGAAEQKLVRHEGENST